MFPGTALLRLVTEETLGDKSTSGHESADAGLP